MIDSAVTWPKGEKFNAGCFMVESKISPKQEISRMDSGIELGSATIVVMADEQTRAGQERYPTPSFALREGRIDGSYAVAMVNHSLKDYAFRDEYPWHLTLSIRLVHVNGEGLPTPDEATVLNAFEDRIGEMLGTQQALHFVARETRRQVRVLHWYLVDPQRAAQRLQALIEEQQFEREFEFTIRCDPAWQEVAPLFDYSLRQ